MSRGEWSDGTAIVRGQWTSASAAEADSLCPGRHFAQRNLPDQKTPDAELGDRVHELLKNGACAADSEQYEIFKKCCDVERKAIAQIFSDTPTTSREKRFWMRWGSLQHSGQADVVHVIKTVGLILDYKTGRNEVAASSSNLQLRDLACLAAAELGLSEVHVAIIQPWVTMTPEICTYEGSDLRRATDEMKRRVEASNNPNAKRIPGDVQCQWCKAKAICPEARELALTPPLKNVPAGATPEALAATLTNDHLSAFLERASVAVDIIEACMAEAKKRLIAGGQIPGYTLKPGTKRSEITDPQECFNRCANKGVPLSSFMEAITVRKGQLEKVVKLSTGSNGKSLKSEMEEILNGITTETITAPSLVRVKE